MKKVLVTGADGFIGRHLVQKLLSEEKKVFGVVFPGANAYRDLQNANLQIMEIDLNHALQHTQEFPAGEIDVMYHCAWIGIKPEDRDRFDLQLQNVRLTMACLELASAIGVQRIVYPGTNSEYLYYGKPLNQDAVPAPADAYGAVKTALRYLCEAYAKKKEIDFVYTILTSVYSEERCDDNVVYYTVNKLLRREKPVFTGLEQFWDFIYIDDAVEALYLAGEKGKKNAVYAIGRGDNLQMRTYIETIRRLIDDSLPLGIGEIPYTDDRMPSTRIDLTELRRDTGFVPRVDFEEGIAKVIKSVNSKIRIDAE